MAKHKWAVTGHVPVKTYVLAANAEEARRIAEKRAFLQGCAPDPERAWLRGDGEVRFHTAIRILGEG